MGFDEKFGNKAEEFKGQTKEAFGDATDNEQLEAEGKADQSSAKLKQGVEAVKDKAAEVFNDVADKFKKD